MRAWIDHPAEPLEPDFDRPEYELRVSRARKWMAAAGLDALVITSSTHARHFTGESEPHEWHDRCPVRISYFVLTGREEHLWLNPGMGGEHLSTARRMTRVPNLHPTLERAGGSRMEIWQVEQLATSLADLGLGARRLGFELGDCTTLGMSYLDFERLRRLMPAAEFVDGAPVLRRCLQIQTAEEIARVRVACGAAVSMHHAVASVLKLRMSERELLSELSRWFGERVARPGLSYRAEGGWDVRSLPRRRWSPFHAAAGDWVYAAGDVVARATGGTTFRGYPGDVDRTWHVGRPTDDVRRLYDGGVACLRAMVEAIGPGVRCSDVYAAYAAAARRVGWPERVAGRQGHGIFNGGGISVHPDCELVLGPGG